MSITARGVTRGARGERFPGRRITAGGAEKSEQCLKYFVQQRICFRKISGSNTGAPNLFLAPGAISPRYTPNNSIFNALKA